MSKVHAGVVVSNRPGFCCWGFAWEDVFLRCDDKAIPGLPWCADHFIDWAHEARDEITDLQTAVERVRALHRQGDSPAAKRFGGCLHCRGAWPCPTIRALDGES